MSVRMKPEAVRCFRLLSELSLVLGVVDEDVFRDRMDYLHELLRNPGGALGGGADAAGEVDAPHEGASPNASDGEAHADILAGARGGAAAPPEWIHLIPGGAIAHLKRWHFIKGDPDPMPSVPHGHDEGRPFPKLDPYLGWIHASTTTTSGRLSHDDTRALWNDDRFRDFASAALLHFAQENPHYVWRVPYPMRLPRRG